MFETNGYHAERSARSGGEKYCFAYTVRTEKYKKATFQKEIALIHNLTNSYFHRQNRKEINYGEQVGEISEAIAEGTLSSRWFQKTELDPVFFTDL